MFDAKNHVTRLSMYKAVVKRLKAIGVSKIFSDNLADAAGVTSSQVRKDFSIFGITGNKKAGYQADQLISDIERLLGKSTEQKVVVAGFGNIGRAIVNHKGFQQENIKIVAAFDRDKSKLSSESRVPVFHSSELEEFIRKNKITIAVLAVVDHEAREMATALVKAGIKGILNFSSLKLEVPRDVFINNIDVEMALETVIFYTHSPVKEVG